MQKLAIPVMLLVALSSGLPTSSSHATQEEPLELRPGDPEIDTSVIEPRRTRWIVHRISPDGERRHVAVWIDTERHVEVDGRRLIRAETDALYATGRHRFDIIHRDPETWAPVTVELRDYNGAGGWAFLGYEGDRATTVWRETPDDDARWSTETLPEGHFTTGSGAVLLHALRRDLHPGLTIRYPVHHHAQGGIRYITMEVVGSEPVPGSEERWPSAWKARNSIGWTSWIIDEPPYVGRLEVERPDGLGTDVWVPESVELLEEEAGEPSSSADGSSG